MRFKWYRAFEICRFICSVRVQWFRDELFVAVCNCLRGSFILLGKHFFYVYFWQTKQIARIPMHVPAVMLKGIVYRKVVVSSFGCLMPLLAPPESRSIRGLGHLLWQPSHWVVGSTSTYPSWCWSHPSERATPSCCAVQYFLPRCSASCKLCHMLEWSRLPIAL